MRKSGQKPVFVFLDSDNRPVKRKKRSHKEQSAFKGKGLSFESKKEIIAQVINLAEPLCESEGMELVYVEYQLEGRGRVLRLYIDKPGGIILDDCVYISRQLNDLLDVSLVSDTPYNLEVSSPGFDRPLTKEKNFERFKGQTAKIKIGQPIDGQRNFNGAVILKINDKKVAIPYQEITKARLVDYSGD